MRILVVNWRDVANPEAGGAETFVHEVARRWVEDGHPTTVLTSRFPGAPTADQVDGVSIRRIGKLRNGTFHLAVQREFSRLAGYDRVVETINTVPYLTPLWRRRLPPTVALIFQLADEVWDYELPRPLAAIGRWIEPRLLRPYRDASVVTISESGRRELALFRISDVTVVEPGRDDPPDLSDVEKEASRTFLFAGRLAANKRPDHAVEAFRQIRELVPNARLWIVGRGPLGRKLAFRLPEGVELLGYLPRDELYRRMARAHCLLVPSVREGWGMVVIEANSVGTPAVGYDVPGIRDSIQHGRTGLLSPAGDPIGLARQALAVVSDRNDYERFRRNGQARAFEFSWNRSANRLLDVVRSAAGERLVAAAAAPTDDYARRVV